MSTLAIIAMIVPWLIVAGCAAFAWMLIAPLFQRPGQVSLLDRALQAVRAIFARGRRG